MRKASASLLILLCISLGYALQLDVHVTEVIDGNIVQVDAEKFINNTPQRFLIHWENTGSVGCRVRMGVDIYNEELMYTAWSKELPLEPGDYSELEAWFYPKNSGNITSKIFIYFCNTIQQGPVLNFTAFIPITSDNITNTTRSVVKAKKEKAFDIRAESTENYVEMRIRSKKNIKDLVIIPRECPLGWIFESAKIDEIKKDEEKVVKINYVPSIWKEKTIEFDVVTMDGENHMVKEVILSKKKGYSLEQKVIAILIVVISILLILLYTTHKKRK